jgi:hypothetical protein
VPLTKEAAILPDGEAVRITPPAPEEVRVEPAAADQPVCERPPERSKPMPPPLPTGRSHQDANKPNGEPPRGGIDELIAEAESLRELLHDAFTRTSRLMAALKQQRRQAKAVASAMASLRQLQLHP